MADIDKIHGEGNHHQGCGLMRYGYCSCAMFTHKPISITGDRSVPLQLGPASGARADTFCQAFCTMAISIGGLR